MSKVTFYTGISNYMQIKPKKAVIREENNSVIKDTSTGFEMVIEASKAVTPEIPKEKTILRKEPEYLKVEVISRGNNNPNKKDEPTPYDIYERMKKESILHPINIKEDKSK